jgi:hypothetical protein
MSHSGAATDPAQFRSLIARAGLPADRVVIRDVVPIGHGNTSAVLRLSLDWSGEAGGLPRTLVAKLPRAMPNGDSPPIELFGYEREVAAYREFGPRPPFRIPHCYYGDFDGQGFVLLLEDLSERGRPGEQIAGCRVDDAWAVVRELAGLHAAYWRRPQLESLAWPRRRWLGSESTHNLYARGAVEMRRRYPGALGETAIGVIEAAAPLVSGWAASRPPIPTLIHADPRIDNVIFEGQPGGVRACLIDLQSMMLGDAAFDIAYLMSGSFETEERAAHERDIVAWHAARIREVDTGYDDATAWRHYCENAVSGLIATVSAAAVLPGDPHVDELLITLARRNTAFVADVGGLEAAARRAALAV